MKDKASHEKSDQVDCGSNEQRDDCAKKSNAFDEKIHHNQVLEDDLNNGNDEAVNSLSQLSILSSIDSKESPAVGSSVHQMPWEKGNQKFHDNSAQDGGGQNVEFFFKSKEPLSQSSFSKSHSMSVSQALDALTGFDDSTQMAVNTVFGVIENLIDQLEKSNQKGDEAKKNEEQATRKGFNDGIFINEEKSYNVDFIKRETRTGLSQPANQTENPLKEGGIASDEDRQIKLGHRKAKFALAPSSDRSIMHSKNDIAASFLRNTKLRKHGVAVDLTLDAAMKKYWLSPYAAYLHRYIKPLPSRSLLDLEMATDLFLDPEEDQWKMIDQPLSSMIITGQNGKDQNANFASGPRDMTVIEPSNAILDDEYSKFNNELSQEDDDINDNEQEDSMKEKQFFFIKNTLLGVLEVEIHRRMNIPDSEEIDSLHAFDLESFTDKVSRAIVSCGEFNSLKDNLCDKLVKLETVERQKIVEIILSAWQDTSHLRKVLSSDLAVCSSLASLRTYFQVVGLYDNAKKPFCKPVNKQQRSCGNEYDIKKELSVTEKVDKAENEHHLDSVKSSSKKHEDLQSADSNNGSFIFGAATTALGASTLLESCQKTDEKKNAEEILDYSNRSYFSDDEFRQKNIVSSLAEKSMFVASPVVPTKSDGKVDHERLAAILAGLGQKGGLLRSVGKVALLWGGIYGALRLTNKLITFLHIAERPLFQRVFGFVCMVLVLWSPVVIPLLPALVQSWTTHNPIRIAEAACTVGFYIAAMILVILWGKRIRGYDNPIEQYGLNLTTPPRVFDFLKGMTGGFMIVSCIHLINALLGYAYFTWPAMLPLFSSHTVVSLRACGSLLLLIIQGIVPATGISVVEELLFRSWLPEEIAADLGYNYSVIISGIIFAIIQSRSLPSVLGFLLLSICLSGIKQRADGKLAIPIGIRTGVMAASFVVQRGDLLGYRAGTPPWLAGPHHLHPFDGPVGVALCALLAILFFPKLPHRKKIHRPIRKGKC